MGSIFALLDIIELVCEALQVLGFDHVLHVVRLVSLFSIGEALGEVIGIISMSGMSLNHSRLVHMALSVFSNVFWS